MTETQSQRIHAIVYSNDSREELGERIVALEDENAKLRELARKQDALTRAVHAYWAGGDGSLDDFNVMMGANAQVLSLMRELGIEAK